MKSEATPLLSNPTEPAGCSKKMIAGIVVFVVVVGLVAALIAFKVSGLTANPTDFGSLFTDASKSVGVVVFAASVGAYARHREFLTKAGNKELDNLIKEVLTPAVIFFRIIPNANAHSFAAIWPMAVMCLVVVLTGLTLGWLSSSLITKGEPRAAPFKGLLMVALAFPNSFSVPLTLQLALSDCPIFMQDHTMKQIIEAKGQTGAPTAADVQDHTLNLFLFSYVIWVFMRWSVGFPVLSGTCEINTIFKKVVNAPTVACVSAVILGFVYSAVKDTSAPIQWLSPVALACKLMSSALVPAMMLTLGAKMYETVVTMLKEPEPEVEVASNTQPLLSGASKLSDEGAKKPPQADEGATSVSSSGVPTLPGYVYGLIVLLRQVVGCSIAVGGAYFFMAVGVTDKVAMMVAMMQAAGPPMISLTVMAALSDSSVRVENEVGWILLVTYGASILTWTAGIVTFLHVLK